MQQEILLNSIQEGSRHFYSHPQDGPHEAVIKLLKQVPGLKVTRIVTDNPEEIWIDFSYMHYTFTVNTQAGDYWFLADESSCPEEILHEIVANIRLTPSQRRQTRYRRGFWILTIMIPMVVFIVSLLNLLASSKQLPMFSTLLCCLPLAFFPAQFIFFVKLRQKPFYEWIAMFTGLVLFLYSLTLV